MYVLLTLCMYVYFVGICVYENKQIKIHMYGFKFGLSFSKQYNN